MKSMKLLIYLSKLADIEIAIYERSKIEFNLYKEWILNFDNKTDKEQKKIILQIHSKLQKYNICQETKDELLKEIAK